MITQLDLCRVASQHGGKGGIVTWTRRSVLVVPGKQEWGVGVLGKRHSLCVDDVAIEQMVELMHNDCGSNNLPLISIA